VHIVVLTLCCQAYAAAGDYNASVNQLHTAISLNAAATNTTTGGGNNNDKDVGESEAAQVITDLNAVLYY
jgi:hypothetical protein